MSKIRLVTQYENLRRYGERIEESHIQYFNKHITTKVYEYEGFAWVVTMVNGKVMCVEIL